MSIFNHATNEPSHWDELLSSDYLHDVGSIDKRRISFAAHQISKGDNILNIGSGQGYLEDRLRYELESGLVNWTSLDISKKGLQRIKRLHPQVSITESSILKLSFNKEFDLVFCMEVLEHLRKDVVSKAYQQIIKVVKKDGLAIVSVPVFEPRSLVNHPVGHQRKYTPAIFKDELRKHNFEIRHFELFFAFRNLITLKEFISKEYHLRRPSVALAICQKR